MSAGVMMKMGGEGEGRQRGRRVVFFQEELGAVGERLAPGRSCL